MITGVELLPFMCNKPWPLRFLTQQQYKVLIRVTGLVLLLVGILYAVQIIQFEARKRLIPSSYDSADNPTRKYIAETDWLPTTLNNLSTDELANDNNSYTTERSWSPYRGGVDAADMPTKRNYNYTSVSRIPRAGNDDVADKSDKTCDNCRIETDFKVSSGVYEDGNYSSQTGWLNDQETNASAAISMEGHSNNTEASWIPALNISALVTAKDYGNYSSEKDMLPTFDSKVLAATSVKVSNNYRTIVANQFTSVDRNMFTAVTPKNYSNLSQTNRQTPLNNISDAINTKGNLNVIERSWRFIRGSNISNDKTVNDNNYTSETLLLLASINDTSKEKSVFSIKSLPSKVTPKNLPSNVNNNYASKKNLFTISLLLFCLNHG